MLQPALVLNKGSCNMQLYGDVNVERKSLNHQLLNKYSTYKRVKLSSGHSYMQSTLSHFQLKSMNNWVAAVTTGGQIEGKR